MALARDQFTAPARFRNRTACPPGAFSKVVFRNPVRFWLCYGAIFILTLAVTSTLNAVPDPLPVKQEPFYRESRASAPAISREFRGVWVATVGNIDWPSTNSLTTEQQKSELVAIMDKAARLKLNVLIFQVRPACDALYSSTLEPWSEYLTGAMGKAPDPYYDPLSFAIEEAHKRGLELHAWFNPYRARHSNAKSPVSPTHISKTRPQLVRNYGYSLWLDPGEKDVQEYSLSVVMDVVRRYDVDGIHFDDYFYPYKVKGASGADLAFPDEPSWKRYGSPGRLDRDDWRRENVNQFIQRAYKSIKAAKPWVKFGVSPFGIWRPGNPPQIRGFDAFEDLYADSKKWLAAGWVDYFAPQLYWSIDAPQQSFPVLLNWWHGQNSKQRILAPGLDDTKTMRQWSPDEIVNQIALTRKTSGADGQIHWNMKSLLRNAELGRALADKGYGDPALVPPCPWLSRKSPVKPRISANVDGARLNLRWETGEQGAENSVWVLSMKRGTSWKTEILPSQRHSMTVDGPLPDLVAIRCANRYGNLSAPFVLETSQRLRQ